jgi:hypothetical protein
MAEGGVSRGEVHAIVESKVSPLRSAISELNSRVSNLEAELSRLGYAVERMSDLLAQKLDQVNSTQHALVEAQRTTHRMTHEQFVAANTQLQGIEKTSIAGFTATHLGLKDVNGSVVQMVTATAQMEVIKTINDAREPLEKLKGFAAEIDERFGKAVENVYLVRGQYDQLLATQMAEYDKKLHLIGEHIYAIYEQDFLERAEVPLMQPVRSFIELPLALDDARLGEREAALEGCLLEVTNTGLSPLLDLQRDLENQIARQYAAEETARVGEAAVPLDLCIYTPEASRSTEVIAGARLETRADRASSGHEPRFDIADRSDGMRRQLEPHGSRLQQMTDLRPITTQERDGLIRELQKMADGGELSPEVLQGYIDYLESFGLEVARGGKR